ncbi:Ig-like domain-containing protein, partial [Oleiphilus sp. HI0043]|uniref:Ig-like domain-containing protein n=9 Tax=unclassified Oleiphilus TaxID=2631174 RepID=UPI000A824592
SVITVQLSDINNNDLARGGNSVDITADIGSVGPVTDLGNGSYTAVLTSSTTVGTATISASLEGSTIVDTTSVEFTPLPASMSDTLITATPNTLTADGSTTSTILLQAINVLGNGLNSGGSTVSFAASMGSIGDVTDLNDGFYSATYTSPTNTGVAIISATFDGEDVIDTEMINLQAGALLASSGVITSLDAAVIANGSNTTT